MLAREHEINQANVFKNALPRPQGGLLILDRRPAARFSARQ